MEKRKNKTTSESTIKKNSSFMEAYHKMVIVIENTQLWLGEERLRMRIERDLSEIDGQHDPIYQCITPWCVLSIVCNEKGLYKINCSLDVRAYDLVGRGASLAFLCRFRENFSGRLKSRINITKLDEDCSSIFDEHFKKPLKGEKQRILLRSKHRFMI
jgi:hypothetical protein